MPKAKAPKLADVLGETRGEQFEAFGQEVADAALAHPDKKARMAFMRLIPVALVEGLREIAPDGEPDAEKCLAMFQEAAFVMGAVTAANLFAEFETAPMDVRAGLANQLMLYFFEGMRVALEGGQT